MLAYHAIDANTENNEPSQETTTSANTGETSTIEVKKEDNKTTFSLIENIIKNYKHTYKTHRSVADSDTGYYINKVVMAMKMSSFMLEHQKKISGEEQQQQQELRENGQISSSASGSVSD
jgi:hypothetical protein